MNILGAGLSGLLAGALDRRATIFEAQPKLPHNHWAVLRFREDKIGRALNIPFRRVRVLKAVCVDGVVTSVVTPAIANLYSRKAIGAITSRSILDLEPVDRYIAPGDLIPRLAEMCEGRINLGYPGDIETLRKWRAAGKKIISTIPLPAMLNMIGAKHELEFMRAPIRVNRYRVEGADAFQTIYFPSPKTPVYRATLTGDELILELTDTGIMRTPQYLEVLKAFGLRSVDAEMLNHHKQALGKIVPLPREQRQALLLKLTTEHGIFSLGRFATWRNVLLDDVFSDFYKVRELMALSNYDLLKVSR